MDWGLSGATATVVALSDGHASVYLSNGGGFLGGAQANEAFRQAARAAVHAAAELPSQLELTTEFPLPEPANLIFYLLTDSGVFISRGSQTDFESRQHPLTSVGAAMQAIIAEYRKLQ